MLYGHAEYILKLLGLRGRLSLDIQRTQDILPKARKMSMPRAASVEATQYRCRLYQDKEETFPGEHLLTDVWDELGQPAQSTPPETEWNLIGTFTGDSKEEVQQRLKTRIGELGSPPRGSWAGRGMI
jgi:hypothetical protein